MGGWREEEDDNEDARESGDEIGAMDGRGFGGRAAAFAPRNSGGADHGGAR
jgi:hypothetical protein